jgi:hypothetical protein
MITDKEYNIVLTIDRFREIISNCFDFNSNLLTEEEVNWFEQFRSGTNAKCVSPNFSQVILQVCE